MNSIERKKLMEKSDSLDEILSYSCDVPSKKAKSMVSEINSIESFLEKNGFSRGKPRKMAVMYIMMRHSHRPRSIEKWWGKTDSSYESFSADLGKNYLEEIKEFINDKVDYEKDSGWTPGDKVYDPNEDPLNEYFNIENKGRNSKITSF